MFNRQQKKKVKFNLEPVPLTPHSDMTTSDKYFNKTIGLLLWEDQQSFIMTQVFTYQLQQKCDELERALGFTSGKAAFTKLHKIFGETFKSQEKSLIHHFVNISSYANIENVVIPYYINKLQAIDLQVPHHLPFSQRFFGRIKIWIKSTFSSLSPHDKKLKMLISNHEPLKEAHQFISTLQKMLLDASQLSTFPHAHEALHLDMKPAIVTNMPLKSILVKAKTNETTSLTVTNAEKLKKKLAQTFDVLQKDIKTLMVNTLIASERLSKTINNASQPFLLFDSSAAQARFNYNHVILLKEKADKLQILLEPSAVLHPELADLAKVNFQGIQKEINQSHSISRLNEIGEELHHRKKEFKTIKESIAKLHEDFQNGEKYFAIRDTDEFQSNLLRL